MGVIFLLAAILFSPWGGSPSPVHPENAAREYDRALRVGESRWKEGNFEGARRLLILARDLAQEMKNVEEEVRCLMHLGKLCWALGRPEDSTEFYSQAYSMALASQLKRPADESRLALDISKLYSEGQSALFAGEVEKSISAFRSGAELARKIKSLEHELKCLGQLSLGYWTTQDLGGFLSVNERSLEIAEELNDLREKARSLINEGLYYLNMREYSRALNFYSDALDISRAARNDRDTALCFKNIGLILFQLGFFEVALGYLEEARAIDLQSGNRSFFPLDMINLGKCFRNSGHILANMEDLYRGLEYFTEALNLAEKGQDMQTQLRALNNIGNIYLSMEKYFAAKHYFRLSQELAEEIPDPGARLEVLNNLGLCNLKTGKLEAARRQFEAALDQGRRLGKGELLWEVLFNLGKCFEQEGNLGQALDLYTNSVSALELIRSRIAGEYYKVGFMKDKSKIYEAIVDLLCSPGIDGLSSQTREEIFSAVERAKARAFLESLGEEQGDFRSRLNPSLAKKENEISSRISSVIQELTRKDLPSAHRAELQRTLKRYEDEYLNFISRIKMDTPEQVRPALPLPLVLKQARERLLDGKTAILEYFLGEKNSLLFLVTENQLEIFPLPPKAELESSVNAYIKLLSEPPEGEWEGALAAERLSRSLLLPALRLIPKTVEHLVFVPDGPLFHFPFETLPFSFGDSMSGKEYLISRYSISYAPSCSALSFLKERPGKDRHTRGLLAFGNPLPPSNRAPAGRARLSMADVLKETYEGQGFDFSSLPQSDREIQEIASYFSQKDRTLCLRGAASKKTLKAMALEGYRIIHFACHGFIDEKVPYRSALVLSPDESSGEDGFLQVREIANLRLAAELVVLSACETGRGRIEKGEGILGLTRSFFYSGARSVVSALWIVGDQASAKFMRHFYFYLSQKKTKAQALRLAKLEMLKSKYAHPFYWAPYILHGESSSPIDFP